MYIGQRLLVKHNGVLQEGNVEQIFQEDLEIKLDNNIIIMRKFWETHKVEIKNEENS